MKKIDIDELKCIQLEMLKAIDSFCKKNDIKYSLAFGSLLGAVRHKGYIPWDDDLDIMILRKDYMKFIKEFNHDIYTVIEPENNADYSLPFAKVYDIRTIMNEFAETKTVYGVYIDVFPVDNTPDDPKKMDTFLKQKARLNKQHLLKIVPLRKERSIVKNIILAIGHILFSYKSLHDIALEMNRLSSKYSSNTNCRLKGIIVPNDNRMEELLPSEYFDSYSTLRFEDIEIMVIEKYDEYLKASYGDYMQLPPKEKQVSHHQFEAYWK